jgi:hypothetical protein
VVKLGVVGWYWEFIICPNCTCGWLISDFGCIALASVFDRCEIGVGAHIKKTHGRAPSIVTARPF